MAGPKALKKLRPPLLDAVTLAATRTSRSFSMSGRSVLALVFNYTYSAATAVTWYVEVSYDGGTTWCRLIAKDISIAAAVATGTAGSEIDSMDVSASKNWTATYDNILGTIDTLARVVAAGTGGAAGDILTVHGVVG